MYDCLPTLPKYVQNLLMTIMYCKINLVNVPRSTDQHSNVDISQSRIISSSNVIRASKNNESKNNNIFSFFLL